MTVIERAVRRLREFQNQTVANVAEERGTRDEPSEQVASPARRASRREDIDLVRLGAMGFISPADPRSLIAEEFRVIKRPIIQNAVGGVAGVIKDSNLVMVTSALAGEGKSTCAVNLALSIAMELDSTVLLVDADVAKPSLPELLGISIERGLLDVLADESIDMSEVLLRTNLERLSVLPSGMPRSCATEMLASDAMRRLVRDMSARYRDRVIVFDSPPLLQSTEARAMASHMGQLIVVVEAERTPQSAVLDALGAIEACPVKLMLLNKRSPGASSGQYGYGYGYG